jgi:peroxiredoxin
VSAATSLRTASPPAQAPGGVDVPLRASNGQTVAPISDSGSGAVVLYFYPGTEASPEDGVRSEAQDLAQHLEFAAHDLAFRSVGCRVFGISTQPHHRQVHYAEIARIDHLLLSDPQLSLAAPLGLPTFNTGENEDFYSRALLLVPHDAEPARLTVVVPKRYPASALAWLRENAATLREQTS